MDSVTLNPSIRRNEGERGPFVCANTGCGMCLCPFRTRTTGHTGHTHTLPPSTRSLPAGSSSMPIRRLLLALSYLPHLPSTPPSQRFQKFPGENGKLPCVLLLLLLALSRGRVNTCHHMIPSHAFDTDTHTVRDFNTMHICLSLCVFASVCFSLTLTHSSSFPPPSPAPTRIRGVSFIERRREQRVHRL